MVFCFTQLSYQQFAAVQPLLRRRIFCKKKRIKPDGMTRSSYSLANYKADHLFSPRSNAF